jgi:hypothetical protein
MMNRKFALSLGVITAPLAAGAQVSDLLNAFDAGSSASATGNALLGFGANSSQSVHNPAVLAYVDRREVSASYRNLPRSVSVVGGTFDDLERSTEPETGNSTLTHLGYVFPASAIRRGASGSAAVSYTVTGYMEDEGFTQTNSVLPVGGGVGIQNYGDRRFLRTDRLTLGYGRANALGNFAIGINLDIVQTRTSFRQTGTVVDNNNQPFPEGSAPLTLPDVSSTGYGVGLTIGALYSDPNQPNITYQASLATPVDLSGNGSTSSYFDVIPGRFSLGAAARTPGFRRNARDFAVVGIQADQYFGGKSSRFFDRSAYTAFGIGAEYNADFGSARVPFRLGYRAQPAGGEGFTSRNGFSYGFGYRPTNDQFAVDFTYNRPDRGGTDIIITATYRFR